jgi:hypothetical protein
LLSRPQRKLTAASDADVPTHALISSAGSAGTPLITQRSLALFFRRACRSSSMAAGV